MDIEISEILDAPNQRVRFRSHVGTATGTWPDPNPVSLGRAHVEFDIPNAISEWRTLDSPSPNSIEDVNVPKSSVRIVATVIEDGSDDDPVVTIRVGTAIIMIEPSERRSEMVAGSTIAFTAPDLHLYPTNL
jgi:hypothetical protein